MKKLPVLSTLAAFALLAGSLLAQRPMQRLPGLPTVTPPVHHPALAGQPLITDGKTRPQRDVKVSPKAVMRRPAQPPETHGVKRSGKDLKAAVKKVSALPWHHNLHSARADARRDGKPVLLLQTLGDLDGFA